MKGASEHFHFLSVLAGTYDNTVRNIDIGRVGYLRHSFIAGFPTERVPKMPLSGVSTRSGDLARFNFKGLDGTMTDLFIHLSGTGLCAGLQKKSPLPSKTTEKMDLFPGPLD